jgi:type II restriction enzyme
LVKPDDAKAILAALGMPMAQQNPNAVYTLLAFANIGPRTPWSKASNPRRTPHDVIAFARDNYQKVYAKNTRETIRRQAIHQFVQGGLLARNPGDPNLATNSPRTHYALTREALDVIRTFGTKRFEGSVRRFLTAQQGGLAELYGRARKKAAVAVSLPGGKSLELSPGAHNLLQAEIIHTFLPRFAADASVLYLGDTDHKTKLIDEPRLTTLGVPVTKHDKLPDVVLYDEHRNWLFLVEAVTSHGPVSAKRHIELETFFTDAGPGRVYVSAFPSFREFKKYADEIAWETEAWVAEFPEHLLHYNGDRFFGPRHHSIAR